MQWCCSLVYIYNLSHVPYRLYPVTSIHFLIHWTHYEWSYLGSLGSFNIKHPQPGEPANVFMLHPDSTAVFHRSLGMYKRVQSVGTLRPMLEPVSHKAQHEHGLWTASVNFLQDSFTSPGHEKGKLLSSSHTQNQWSAKCVRKSSTPGVWLYSRWSTDTGQNTGNGWDIYSRVHKLLKIKKLSKGILSLYCIVLLS